MFDERRKYITSRLNELGFTCKVPKGAFYALPNVTWLFSKKHKGEELRDLSGVANFLLDEARVALLPGSAFEASQNVRIAYSNSLNNIKRELDNIKRALEKLS
jgi:aspartate aminotransferase